MRQSNSFGAVLLILGSVSLCHAQLSPLSFRPVAWRGSQPLDRIIMISASPDLLHIYNPLTGADTTVGLPKTPLSLSVSPDGTHAAVGHDGTLTWIDLTSASVLNTFTISGKANLVILGDRAAWFFAPGNGYTGGLSGLDLSSGTAITSAGLTYYYATNGVLDASQSSLYLSQDGSSPNDMEKAALGSSQLTNPVYWPYHGDYGDCGPYYLSLDGSRIYTSCGTIVHASTDKTIDMYYAGTLPATAITSLSESGALGEVAVIPGSAYYTPTSSTLDTQIQFFHTDYLTAAGNLSLLPFVLPGGTFAAHGKGVFFSKDSQRVYALVQADSTSNLSTPFAVETFNLANPAACSVQLPQASASVNSWGGVGSLAVTATPDCVYSASSSVSWIMVTGGGQGSGNGTVNWVVRPNESVEARSGGIVVNGATFNIQQSGIQTSPGPLAGLSVNVVDAAYSKLLDQVVVISATPNELHMYDPVAMTDNAIPLALPPFSLSVEPDGRHAAVGHDGWISYIDLSAQKVLQMFPIVTDVHHILAAGNGYIYAFPQRDWSPIYSLQIATGAVTAVSAIYEGRIPRMEPNGLYFYLAGSGWFSKWSIAQGAAVSVTNSPGLVSLGNNFWLSQDGSQLIAATGKVYATSDVPAHDMQYTGSYYNVNNIAWAANSTAFHTTAVIPGTPADTQVMLFGDAFLSNSGTLPLPPFSSGGSNYPGHGLFAFWNNAASELFVVERADSSAKLASTDAVYAVNTASGCGASLAGALPTIPAGGGFGSALITAGAGCLWTAKSDNPWLTVTSVGAGAGLISWSAAANTSASNRSANITIAGQAYPITQLGTAATPLALSVSTLSFTATWASTVAVAAQSFSVKAGVGSFQVAAYPAWVRVAALSPSTYTVSVDPTGLPAGGNNGIITVTAADGQVQIVTITLTITPKLAASPASLTFQYQRGDAFPSAAITISDGMPSGSTFTIFTTGGVTVTPNSGTLPAILHVTPNISSIGTANYTISVNSNNASSGSQGLSVPVKITVTGPPVTVNSITNAGDFLAGPIAPGEIVVISGSGLGPAALSTYIATASGGVPTRVAGTSVTFNNYAAPILSSSASAVYAIVPYELAGQTSASVIVSYNGSVSAAFAQAMAATAPHFFTKISSPTGPIVALNSDYTPNSASNPASAGSIVVIYATGEGVISPPGIDGSVVSSVLPQPLAKVTATVGGQAANVSYAGGSPGYAEGLLQINIKIPDGTAPGNVTVVVQIGSNSTPSGGTIAVN